ncbi:hypothetical protein [Paenibacillus abyssi]|uniref:AAA domain-containing protein n=1 Tax=Paenibacillus abyssi TaxID=1340531 RepID=A0A917FVM5_9BACL|nr:hypothetical protein [Paenibacillus abyssi]GGG04870.1 hypothetical protein GCM10010916_22480 [Paenibacillus abyssi]
MRIHSLVIAAKEQEYVKRLAEYIRESPATSSWQVTAFTHPPALKQYLRSGYPADLLALQPNFLEEAKEVMPAKAVAAALVRHLGEADDYEQLLQYQPLPQLLKQLNEIYTKASGGSPLAGVKEGTTPVAAIYSAIGGIGKTTLALNLAKQAAEGGKRVFYLNLEMWNATGMYFGGGADGEDDFSRMLYMLQSGSEQSAAQFASIRKHHPGMQIDYFQPAPSPDERLALTSELASAMVDMITSSGQYDLLVIDLDCRMDDVFFQVLEECGLMLWLNGTDVTAKRKTELAVQYGRRKRGEAFRELEAKLRIIQVGVHAAEEGGRPSEQSFLSAHGLLPFHPQWHQAEQPAQLLSSPPYRGAVTGLLKQWIWPEGGAESDRGGGARAAGLGAGEDRSERIRIG